MRTSLSPHERTPYTGADHSTVAAMIAEVRAHGDAAVADFSRRFDGVDNHVSVVPMEALAQAWTSLPADDRAALQEAADNIRTFAQAQRSSFQPTDIAVGPGAALGSRVLPIARVACYVPGGRYPLPSTVLMTVIPAKVAGVARVVVVSPPSANGLPSKWILAAAHLAGADEVLAIGGAHAIAAVAYGTETIAPVDLIVGPGNAWVTEAKRQVFGQVGIDALAGPSEVVILTDETADPARVAADMLAQAEHDPDAEAIALTDSATLAEAIRAEVSRQLDVLPTADVARKSIDERGAVLVMESRDAMIQWANARAPEHLHLQLDDASEAAAQCTAYGGLFIGADSAEVFGDYCSGVNHVLPTGGAARYTGGLSVMTYLRFPTHQRLSQDAAKKLAPTAARLARIEGLEAHARSADARK